jgi:hypothetical protein
MKRMGIAIAALLLLIALPLSSQQSEGAPELEQALYQLLQRQDWSPDELQKLIEGDVEWGQQRFRYAELVRKCWEYVNQAGEEIGPYAQVHVALQVMTMAREMNALGFGEPQIIRTALNGTREVLGDLVQLREQERVQMRTGEDNGVGELIRSRFQKQLQTAVQQEARITVQNRVREEQNSRPGDLLVPPGPHGPGGPDH